MKRILIVDDNADSANALGAMLELCGHHVEVVVGALHGLLAVERFEPEIVFLDIGMPEMNGYEVAAKIRSGGVGVWGRLIMPRQPQVTEADAALLAKWVLSQP